MSIKKLKTLKEYHENGTLSLEVETLDNVTHGSYKKYHNNGQLQVELFFSKGRQLAGDVTSFHRTGKVARQVYVDHNFEFQGKFEEFYYDGSIKSRGFYVNSNRYDEEIYYINGILKKSSTYINEKHIRSIYKTEDDEVIKDLHWFSGDYLNHGMKIRKYHRSNRYEFSPRMLCLNRVQASVFYYMFTQVENDNISSLGGIDEYNQKKAEVFSGNGDILIDPNNSYDGLNKAISQVAEFMPDFFSILFNDNALKELSNYKILDASWNSRLALDYLNEGVVNQTIFFKEDLLKLMKSNNQDFLEWVVIDESVKPSAIVFESDSQNECKKWMSRFLDFTDDSTFLMKNSWMASLKILDLENMTETLTLQQYDGK